MKHTTHSIRVSTRHSVDEINDVVDRLYGPSVQEIPITKIIDAAIEMLRQKFDVADDAPSRDAIVSQINRAAYLAEERENARQIAEIARGAWARGEKVGA